MAMRPLAACAALTLLCACAHAQADSPPKTAEAAPEQKGSMEGVGKKAGEIITQPVRDVGVSKPEIPEVLAEAVRDPYSLQGLKTCKQLSAAVIELNVVLGPDYGTGPLAKENRGAKLAEAGGTTVVNSLIPVRQLVREISGAAPAQRSLAAAVDAGLARRGFLRGVHRRQGCRTPF